jgi:hypothetical protein
MDMYSLGDNRLATFRADHDRIGHLSVSPVLMKIDASREPAMWTFSQRTIDTTIGQRPGPVFVRMYFGESPKRTVF